MRIGAIVEPAARVGYSARGAVYIIVGALAVLAGFGSSNQATGSKGALQTLLQQPFGHILLGVIAVGLFAFAGWRLIEALLDPDRLGTELKAIAQRIGRAISAVIYVALAVFAFHLAIGQGQGGGDSDQSTRDWTAWLMSKPFGLWLVGAVGIVVVGSGIAMMVAGWKAKFARNLALDRHTQRWVVPVGKTGYLARGFVTAVIGIFLVVAAVDSNPNEAKGLSGALHALQAQTYGEILLGIVGLGLIAFGLFGFVQAAYRCINTERLAELGSSRITPVARW